MGKKKIDEAFELLAKKDSTVVYGLKQAEGCPDLDEVTTLKCIVAALVYQKNEMFRKLQELDASAIKRYRMPNGEIVVYRPPEDSVPLTVFGTD